MRRRIVRVNDRMQENSRYELIEPPGRNFHPDFHPELTPRQMLVLRVFCGKYMTACKDEFPKSWFIRAKVLPDRSDCSLNYFGVKASQPLSVWREKGWMHPDAILAVPIAAVRMEASAKQKAILHLAGNFQRHAKRGRSSLRD